MANKIGQEFDATISGASDSGVFVELDNTVEGLIFTEKLPPDCYIYDEKKFALIGKKHTYRIGDKLRVKLDQVDIVTRHINFSLAN
jgi:ribonuclease R